MANPTRMSAVDYMALGIGLRSAQLIKLQRFTAIRPSSNHYDREHRLKTANSRAGIPVWRAGVPDALVGVPERKLAG